MSNFEGMVFCPLCGAPVTINTVVNKVEPVKIMNPWDDKNEVPQLRVTFQDIRLAAHPCPEVPDFRKK